MFLRCPRRAIPQLTADVERRLLEHMIELLQHSPGVDRIESQLLLRPHGTHAETLRKHGFQIYERLFMELELSSANLVEGAAGRRLEGIGIARLERQRFFRSRPPHRAGL